MGPVFYVLYYVGMDFGEIPTKILEAWKAAGYSFILRREDGRVIPSSVCSCKLTAGTVYGPKGRQLIWEDYIEGAPPCPRTEYLCRCKEGETNYACPAWLGFDLQHPEVKARHLLRSWALRGCKAIAEEKGRVIPLAEGEISILSSAACTRLVRSIMKGERY